MTPSEIQLLRQLRSATIKQTRISAGICQVHLSQATGLPRRTIYRIEKGLKPWTIDSEIIYLDGIANIISTRNNNSHL